MQKVDIKKIKPNPKNPRVIRDNKFTKLVESIKSFPQMLEKRPLVCFTDVDGSYVVLGGNMRLKASIEVGLKKIPIILADDWTEEQKNEFLIKDNISFGEWDWDELANTWDNEMLNEWGMDVWRSNNDLGDFFGDDDDDNKEEDNNEDKSSKNTIVLEYTKDDYELVIDAFNKLDGSKEDIVYKLLGL